MNQERQQILPEGSTRQTGQKAQQMNVHIAGLISELVRTTLGPRGMDKLLVDNHGDITVTNDGATILKEMTIEHPTAKMLVEIARTQESEVGDGTTTVVVLAGTLLQKAKELLDKKIHPTVIAKGFQIAAEHSKTILKKLSIEVKKENMDEILRKVSLTTMTGKGAETHKEILSTIVVDALKRIMVDKDVNLDDIKVECKSGADIGKSSLVDGIILDKQRVHVNMPEAIEDARIAILDTGIEIKNLEMDTKIQITNPNQLQQFHDAEAKIITEQINSIRESGANVVISGKGIDDTGQHFLAKAGIFCIRRTNMEDLEKISKATGGKIIKDLKDLKKEDLGTAKSVQEQKVGESTMTFIQGCKNPKSVTILIRGGTDHIAEEIKRAIYDALGSVSAVIRSERVVPGAGSTEMYLAIALTEISKEYTGREQLAIKAFADAMEIIPETLAENAGLDPIDIITEMKSEYQKGQEVGVNVLEGGVLIPKDEGILEPLRTKTQAVSSASEAAIMILRIDDVIATVPVPNQ